ncbi:thiamine pyrophosphate-dependent enzyme [Kocuria sp.]|uniref:thiamine pyrophosphate-dependent enzyme n=1 Tax=Kocuria sp. TaxID=1871328 RepID=UPI0026DEBF3C|nr:thiamine pyrophosphate-dependent enzyme [Kocuria sp.]MDO5618074.1 thiamine pyrophosphate-dependent enzyme [Kocuria sp.]
MSRLTGDEKHSAAATSTLDVLEVLYEHVLNVSPAQLNDPERDRFYLSKGHGPAAYYAVLAKRGFFPVAWLDTFGKFNSPLGHHPDRNLIPGVEIASGSLGHGLPLAVGTALGLKAQGSSARVFVLVGDAELDEGSNSEAIEFAPAAGLNNLTVIAIDNHSSSYAIRGQMARRFAVNGWRTQTVDGHDQDSIQAALSTQDSVIPTAIIAQVEDK